MKARAQDSAVMEDRGTASGHLEVLSIMVRIYEYPWLEGRGPICPDGREKIFLLEQESLEQEISHESELYSADTETGFRPDAHVPGQPRPHKP